MSASPNVGRAVPDAVDLKLLHEIVHSGFIGLAQAAWNAQLTQAEAAARLVEMAERGLPLRLVAQGDQAQLWQLCQRGPATGGVRVATPTPDVTEMAQPPLGRPVRVTEPAALPPHEQAIAGAVPLGGPPFGGPSDLADTWGSPGSASWTRPADLAAATNSWTPYTVTGLSGEHLQVTLLDVIDPGNDVLTAAGFNLEPAERAVLVRTRVDNLGPAPHLSLPDGYLTLLDQDGANCAKAPIALPNRPAHRLGIAAGEHSEGWTIFLIARHRKLAGICWSIRPDLRDKTVTWALG